MVKEILESIPVVIISLVATVTGGTAVSKVVQDLHPALTSSVREIKEIHAATPTPNLLDDGSNTEAPNTASSANGASNDSSTQSPTSTPATKKTSIALINEFTLATLAQHNKPGDCYVAYKGVVYSVSNHPSWSNCTHHGTTGGRDITSSFPHSTSYFATLPKVGTMKGGSSGSTGVSVTRGNDDDGSDDENEQESETDHNGETEREELEIEHD